MRWNDKRLVRLIDNPQYQKLVERVYEYLRDGVRSNEVLQQLMMEDDQMTEKRFIDLLKQAYKYADKTLHKNREYVFQLHMTRYEELYKETMEMEDNSHRPLDVTKDWAAIVTKYKGALKALKSKEDLLGLHDKSVVLEFNDHKAIVIELETLRGGANNVAGFDLSVLNTQELVELLGYIKKARTVPIEGIQRVTIKTTKIEITNLSERAVQQSVTFIDNVEKKTIQFEDMPANVVGRFEDVTKFEDAVVAPEPNVIDDVPREVRKQDKKGIDDVREKIRQKVMQEFRDKLKK